MYIGVHFFSILFIVQFFLCGHCCCCCYCCWIWCVYVCFFLFLCYCSYHFPRSEISEGSGYQKHQAHCLAFTASFLDLFSFSRQLLSYDFVCFFHFAHIFPFLLIIAKPKKHNTYIRAHLHATLIGCKKDAHTNVNVEVARSECIPCNSIPCFTLIILLMFFFLTYLFSFSLLFFVREIGQRCRCTCTPYFRNHFRAHLRNQMECLSAPCIGQYE